MRSIFKILLVVSIVAGVLVCSGNVYTVKKPKQGIREVQAKTIIEQLNKGNHLYLDSCIVWGDLDFTTLNNRNRIAANLTQIFVNQSITFTNCVFINKIKAFDGAKGLCMEFAHNLSFTGCDFRSEVDFSESIVHGHAFFTGSTFRAVTKMQGAHFRHKKTYFTETKFEEEALFQNAVFTGDAHFLHAIFSADAMFQKVIVGGLLFFGDARFDGYADFTYAYAFESIFRYAQFNGRYDFDYSRLNTDSLTILNP